MMTPLTKQEHAILSLIPARNASGAWHAQATKWKIQDALKLSAETLNVYWENFMSAGLIDTSGGFVRRTASGDRALDPVGAVDAARAQTQTVKVG